jgi:hypothetical protein
MLLYTIYEIYTYNKIYLLCLKYNEKNFPKFIGVQNRGGKLYEG